MKMTMENLQTASTSFSTSTLALRIWNFFRQPGLVWLAAVFGIGLILRLHFLSQPMRYDESFSFLAFADHSWKEVFYYPLPNNHVFHTLLVRVTTLLFGSHPIVIRLPAFLAGLFAIPMAFTVCRQLSPGKQSGIIAAMAMSVFPYLVLYSTMARGYSLIVLLLLALIWGGVKLAAEPNIKHCMVLGLIAAIGMFTIPSMLFAVVGVYLWVALLIFCRTGSILITIRHFLLPCGGMTMVMTVLFYLPVVAVTGGITPIVANRFVAGLSFDNFLSRLGPHLLTTMRDFSRNVPSVLLLGGGILILAGFATAVKRRLLPALLLLPCLIIGSIAVLFAKHSIPFARTWIFFLPAVFIIMDIGLMTIGTSLRLKYQQVLVLAAMLLTAVAAGTLIRNDTITAYTDTGHFPEAEQVVISLEPILKTNDKVKVYLPADMPVYYYMRRHGVPNHFQSNKRISAAKDYFIVKKSQYSIEDMTPKKVTRLFDFEDAAVFRSGG